MTHRFSFRCITFFVMTLAITLGILTACVNNTGSSKDKDTNPENTATTNTDTTADSSEEGTGIKAPNIETDASGIITLAQCPTECEGLKVEVSDDITKASVYLDDQLLQTFSSGEDEPLATDGDKSVHFLDANFDGYADIFIGAGESRTYSSLFVWNPSAEQFVRIGELGSPDYQNIALHPATKSVFEGGSASWCANFFSRSIWENNHLKTVENLTFVSDDEQYGDYKVNSAFTLKDSDGKVIFTSNKASELPGQWKDLVEKYLQ